MRYFPFPNAPRSCLQAFRIVFIVFAGVSFLFSQNTLKVCPDLELIGPAGMLSKNQTTEFAVVEKKSHKEFEAAEVKWSVSAGSIMKGNGSSRVTYKADGDLGDNGAATIKVTAVIRESANNCGALLTDTFGVVVISRPDDDIEEFGKEKPSDVKARLDDFYMHLNNSPEFEGYWLIQFERKATPSYRRSMIRRVLDLIKFRRYDANRLSFYILEDSDKENNTLLIATLEHAVKGHAIDKSKLIMAEEIAGKLNKLFPRK
ncbi:hypothetical protein BH10ACI2_BH10ACI2_16300 [soil metagenome]